MTITAYNFFKKLKTEKISCSAIPKTVKQADYFQQLIDSHIIILEGHKNRGTIKVNEEERHSFDAFVSHKFPDAMGESINKAENIKTFRNSKARATDTNNIIFLRGNQQVIINSTTVDLAFHTQNFSVFAVALQSLHCPKICFVENLAAFLNAEKIISQDYIFIHTYGRVGEKLLSKIHTKEVLVFSDYDFVGLDEYLKFKEKFENTVFFMPENYDVTFDKYSRLLTAENKETAQKPSTRVLNSTDEIVVKIRTQIFQTQRFLEQEILIHL